MMDWTDRHCRYFHRIMSQEALLYTEMVTSAALVRGGAVHLLEFNTDEHPIALQLGGSDPGELAQAAQLGQDAGYNEINLNVGCPSDRVQAGTFGAILMKTPHLVAELVHAMQSPVSVPVTVKCRIGVDTQEPYDVLPEFLSRIQEAGCSRVIIHARKAWLQGLSPKENRHIPPLDYDLVFAMREAFPKLHLSINGGIESLEATHDLLQRGIDGVMVGRAAYHRPADILLDADDAIFGRAKDNCRDDIVHAMLPYVANHIQAGGKLSHVSRHMLGLFAGQPGGRHWRRVLSQEAPAPDAGPHTLLRALAIVQEHRARALDAAE